MKDLENIDDLFSSSLENFEVAPPKEAKRAIEQALHKQLAKKNNKGGWLLLAIISGSIMATAMFVQSKSNKNDDQQVKGSIKSDFNEMASFKEHKPIEKVASAISSKSSAKSEAILTHQINAITYDETLKSKSSKLKPNTNSNLKTAQENKHQKNNLLVSESKSSNTLKSFENNKESRIKLNDTMKNNEIFTSRNEDDKILLSALLQPQSFKIPNNEINQDILLPKITTELDSTFNEINSLPLSIRQEESKPKVHHYFIAFNLGTGLNSNQYGKKNIISTQELKDSIAFNKPYLSTQLLFGVQHNNLSLSTGIGFYQQSEKTKYSYIDKKMERILVDSIYIDPNTLDTIVKHNVPVDTLMDIYRTNEEQTVYNTLQIPMIVNYSYAFAGRFQLDVSAGGTINVLLQSKGNYKVSPQGSIIEYQSKSNAPIKAINFTALAMIGLTYDINNKISMQLAFPFQLGLSNFYKREYFISRKVNSTGVQLGLKYNFN